MKDGAETMKIGECKTVVLLETGDGKMQNVENRQFAEFFCGMKGTMQNVDNLRDFSAQLYAELTSINGKLQNAPIRKFNTICVAYY